MTVTRVTENSITRSQPRVMMTPPGREKKHAHAINSHRNSDPPYGWLTRLESGSGDNEWCRKSGTSNEELRTRCERLLLSPWLLRLSAALLRLSTTLLRLWLSPLLPLRLLRLPTALLSLSVLVETPTSEKNPARSHLRAGVSNDALA